MKSTLLFTCVLSLAGLLACAKGSNSEPSPTSLDAGPPAFTCSVPAQSCGGELTCMYVDAGLGSLCVPGACDLVRQTGCGSGEKCDYVEQDGGTTERGCVADGTADVGESCGPLGAQCLAGLSCIPASRPALEWSLPALLLPRFRLRSGQECGDAFRIIAGTMESPSYCVTPALSCDLLNPGSCPYSANLGCYPGPRRPTCDVAGTAPVGDGCEFSNDCVPGAVCSQGTCRALCAFNGSLVCGAGTVCQPAVIPQVPDAGLCF